MDETQPMTAEAVFDACWGVTERLKQQASRYSNAAYSAETAASCDWLRAKADATLAAAALLEAKLNELTGDIE